MPGGRIGFFISRSCGGRPDLQVLLAGKKFSIRVPETITIKCQSSTAFGHTWGLAELQTSRGTSTGQETQSVLAVFLRDINMFGHVECLNGLRGGHAHGHRDPGDGQPSPAELR